MVIIHASRRDCSYNRCQGVASESLGEDSGQLTVSIRYMRALSFCKLVDYIRKDEQRFIDVTCLPKRVLSMLKLIQSF